MTEQPYPDRVHGIWRWYRDKIAETLPSGPDDLRCAAELAVRLTLAHIQTRQPVETEAVPNRELTVTSAITALAEVGEFHTSVILGRSRRPDIAAFRSAVLDALRQHFGMTYAELGKIFDDRDHSTIINACRKADPQLVATLIDKLEQA